MEFSQPGFHSTMWDSFFPSSSSSSSFLFETLTHEHHVISLKSISIPSPLPPLLPYSSFSLHPAILSEFPVVLSITPESTQCCLCADGCGLVCWSMGSLPGAASIKFRCATVASKHYFAAVTHHLCLLQSFCPTP